MNSKSMSEDKVVVPDDVNPDFPFWVVEEDDGSLTINWDPNHPITSVFNDWTEQDFVNMLTSKANELLAKEV